MIDDDDAIAGGPRAGGDLGCNIVREFCYRDPASTSLVGGGAVAFVAAAMRGHSSICTRAISV